MLTDADRAALDLESCTWVHHVARDEAIRTRLGVSPTRHYQRIVRLIDDPDAIAYAPVTVSRLRAVRDRRRPAA